MAAPRGFLIRRAVSYGLGVVPGPARRDRLLVVCGPRTGSELLLRSLSGAYRVHYDGEASRRIVLDPRTYLRGRARWARLRSRGYAAKLLDLQLRHTERWVDHGAALRGLVEDGFAIVHLTREDRLANALSLVVAEHSQIWHVSASGPDEAVIVDPAAVVATLHGLVRCETWARRLLSDVPHTGLVYERDLREAPARDATIRRLGVTLEPSAAPTEAPLAPTSARPSRERIANWAEVERALRATRLSALVDP